MNAPLHTESIDDLSALAWVHEELRRSLEAAHKALRRYVKEYQTVFGSDVDTVDPGVLRQARAQLHQGVGALELVGLPAAATLLRASEHAVAKLSARAGRIDAEAVDTVEQASFALLDYLQRMLGGKPISPLALFPQYRKVQEISDAERVHPADLWPLDWSWHELAVDRKLAPLQADDLTRSEVESQMLALMRDPNGPASSRMSELFAGLATGAAQRRGRPADAHLATLWQLASAFFEAQALGLIRGDVYSKRMTSRLLAQMRVVERGDGEVSDRLAQDLLFFCAQAGTAADEGRTPRVAGARQAFALTGALAVDYSTLRLGRFDPAWVAQAKKRVASAKDAWSGAAGGELHRLAGLAEQFALVGDSLKRLYPSGDKLAAALQGAATQTADSGVAPAPALAMEVATSALYLDASLEDADFDHPEQAQRVKRLAERIDAVRAGAAAAPLDAWMEELYRRVSDRQTMGSVVQELRASLSEVEKAIDQFFREPSQRELLIPVPKLLQSMRGVLSVLGLDQASHAVLRMSDEVDTLAQSGVDTPRSVQSGSFDHLAANLGALGFLIDMLSVQPQMVKTLFEYDAVSGNLRSVVGGGSHRASGFGGLEGAPAASAAQRSESALIEQVQSLALAAAHPEVSHEQVSSELGRLSLDATQADQPALAFAADSAFAALEQAADPAARQSAREELAQVMADFVHSRSGSVDVMAPTVVLSGPAAPAPQGPTGLEDDAEMREIFVEEAREVIQAARSGLDVLAEQPEDMESLTTVRRAFHTLKGSSRMIGLNAFGEAGWAFEQLYNSRLADAPLATDGLIGVTADALNYLSGWIDAIEARRSDGHDAAAVQAVAEAMRLHSERLALAAPGRSLPSLAQAAPGLPQAQELDLLAPSMVAPVAALAAAATAASDAVEPEPAALSAAAEAALDAAPLLPEVQEVSFDLDLDLGGEFDAAAAGAASSSSGALLPALDLPDFGLEPTQAASQPGAEPAITEEAAGLEMIDLNFGASPVQPQPRAPDTDPEQFKVVGPLRIGIPLFNIFLNEADEQSRRLTTEVAEWALELHRPISEAAVALAHSLAGNSATVGHTELSQLARALEHGMTRSQAIGQGDADEARLFVDAAEEIRRLLHQFAAGFLQPVVPSLMERLAEHERLSAERLHTITTIDVGDMLADAAAAAATPAATATATAAAVLADLSVAAPATAPAPSAAFATMSAQLPAQTPAQTPVPLPAFDAPPAEAAALAPQGAPAAAMPALAEAPPPLAPPPTPVFAAEVSARAAMPGVAATGLTALQPASDFAPFGQVELKRFSALARDEHASAQVRADALDDEDDIDAVDAVDAELFPIFEEEAQELLPQLASRLRDWARRPGDPAGASACMRTLHTLKGGARLAGAMRLGEMAHRLETAIEHLLAHDKNTSADVEPLQARADMLSATFEALRSRDATAYAAASEAVERTLPRVSAFTPLLDELPAAPMVAEPGEPAPAAAPTTEPRAEFTTEPKAESRAEPVVVRAVAEPPRSSGAAPAMAIDWARFPVRPNAAKATPERAGLAGSHAAVRVRAPLLDRLVNHAGEVSITRSRIESDMGQLKGSLGDLTENLERLRRHLRDIELQAETQISSRMEAAKASAQSFDPLEMDRFTRFQELTRMMAESVNDVATVQRNLQRSLQSAEDELAAQARLTRDMQEDLLRTRMVEFEGLSERLYRVVRQAAKETGKQVRLDLVGGSIEVDRGVLDRMTGSFEHLLRNSVTHGIELPQARTAAGKDAAGQITVSLAHEGNEVGIEFRDDGAGLDLTRIRAKGVAMGLLAADAQPSEAELANLIFTPGFSTAEQVTELAGRGVGMDVVRSEVAAMGGRIETATAPGQGSSFRLVLPLTTAVTQVVMLRCGETTVAVPSTLVEIVRRAKPSEVEAAYASGGYALGERTLPFFWLGALLQTSTRAAELRARTLPVVVIRSAQQRVALHVDEVLGNHEVVVKNLGPQLSRVPGLAGMTLLASGVPTLIYNPVALATLYGEAARAQSREAMVTPGVTQPAAQLPVQVRTPLVLVVDDSLTVRRVTQRLLVREGYRVTLAKDGLEGLACLAEETPTVVLSDIEMPRMDGFDLVRNLRGDARWRELPVIMITSRIAQKHRDVAAELGVDHYLGKPYSEEDLLALVARYAAAPAMA